LAIVLDRGSRNRFYSMEELRQRNQDASHCAACA
jgi:hypothetical protein